MSNQGGNQPPYNPFNASADEQFMFLGDTDSMNMTALDWSADNSRTAGMRGPTYEGDQDYIPDVNPSRRSDLDEQGEGSADEEEAFQAIIMDNRLPLTVNEADYIARQLDHVCNDYMRGQPTFDTGRFSTNRYVSIDGEDVYSISINGSDLFWPHLQGPDERHDISLQERLVVDHLAQALYSWASIDLQAQVDEDMLNHWSPANVDRFASALRDLKFAINDQQGDPSEDRHQLHSSVWWSQNDGRATWALYRGEDRLMVDSSYIPRVPATQGAPGAQ